MMEITDHSEETMREVEMCFGDEYNGILVTAFRPSVVIGPLWPNSPSNINLLQILIILKNLIYGGI